MYDAEKARHRRSTKLLAWLTPVRLDAWRETELMKEFKSFDTQATQQSKWVADNARLDEIEGQFMLAAKARGSMRYIELRAIVEAGPNGKERQEILARMAWDKMSYLKGLYKKPAYRNAVNVERKLSAISARNWCRKDAQHVTRQPKLA